MNKRFILVPLVLFTALTLLLTPAPLFAQSDDAEPVKESDLITGSVQIVAADPLAIRALLQEPAVIPGGYASYAAAVFWTMIFGALGGLVFELLRLRGYIALPHRYKPGRVPDNELFQLEGFIKPRSAIDLGVFARMFVGAMAALAILLVISPAGRLQLIAVAVIAGSAGASIFDTMRARLTASLAVADAVDVRAKSEQLEERLDKMAELIAQLQAQSRGAPSDADDESTAEMAVGDEAALLNRHASAPMAEIDPDTLDQLSILLGEAKGIRTSMQRRRPTSASIPPNNDQVQEE